MIPLLQKLIPPARKAKTVWGKMDAQQMVEHMRDACKGSQWKNGAAAAQYGPGATGKNEVVHSMTNQQFPAEHENAPDAGRATAP
jgi:hypothetical protein